jgi:DNA-binding MarR family transcriptional regulator
MYKEVLKDLNKIFQVKARLGIMMIIISEGDSDFSTLKSYLELTDGNLGAHLKVLEDKGYLKIKKRFVDRKPKTICQVTEAGREAFMTYLKHLETVIKSVVPKSG